MTQVDHSRFAPSSMARIVQCPGSVKLAALYPEPEGPEAAEGNAAHATLAALLNDGELLASADDDMRDGAKLAADFTRDWGATLDADFTRGWGAKLQVEQRVEIPAVHADCWGTPDVYAWRVPGRRLHVIDYKYGHGFVDAYENWQLMAYASGLMSAAGLNGLQEQACVVHLHIVQPRNYHRDGPIRTWNITAAGLRPYVNRMRAACEQADKPDAPLHVGPECKHCPARHACPSLQRAALDALEVAGTAVPLDLPTPAAGTELRRVQRGIKLLEARASGLEAQVTDALRKGESVQGWALEQGMGREAWTAPAEQVRAVAEALGVKVDKPGLITPTQARKAGLPEAITAAYAARPKGEVKLVADDGRKAAQVFGSAQ